MHTIYQCSELQEGTYPELIFVLLKETEAVSKACAGHSLQVCTEIIPLKGWLTRERNNVAQTSLFYGHDMNHTLITIRFLCFILISSTNISYIIVLLYWQVIHNI